MYKYNTRILKVDEGFFIYFVGLLIAENIVSMAKLCLLVVKKAIAWQITYYFFALQSLITKIKPNFVIKIKKIRRIT